MTAPLTEVTGDLEFYVKKITRPFTTPQFPIMARADRVLIPHLKFLKGEWIDSWNRHKAEMGYHENVNAATCDDIATGACAHFNRIVRKKAKALQQDFTGGMFVARIHINEAPFMGIIDTGPHFTTWVAYTTNSEDYNVALWEPQMTRFTFLPIEEACKKMDWYDADK